jgi:putative ABC transport system permease protein
LFRLALRNLTRRRTRTLLTILGVAVAITFTVGLLSITEGFMKGFNMNAKERKEDVFVLPKGAPGIVSPMLASSGAEFAEERIQDISDLPNVETVYPVYTREVFLGDLGDGTSSFTQGFIVLDGVTPDFLPDLRPTLEAESGRLLEEGDHLGVVVGAQIARSLELQVDQTLPLGPSGLELRILGILESTGGLDDYIVYAPLQDVQLALHREGWLTGAAVTVKDPDVAEETADAINNLSSADLFAQTSEEIAGIVKDLISMARAIHLSVASIALLIGILFVLSTMLMAVSERTKEIGTMRAIGVHRVTIFRLIVTESLITGAIAGGIGCLGGIGLSKLITWAIHRFAGAAFLQAVVSPRLLGFGLLIAVLIGILAGLYPAWRISKTNIVEALRYE